MSNKIYIQNESLDVDQRIDPEIDFYDVNDDKFEDKWLYDNKWPREKLADILDKINSVDSFTINDNPKFWDFYEYGKSIYNHSLNEFYQIEEEVFE